MTGNPADGIKDAMWYFLRSGGQRPNPEAMEDIARDIIQLMTQKNSGQKAYRKASDLNFDNFDMLVNMAAIEMVALVISDQWDSVKEALKRETVEGSKE